MAHHRRGLRRLLRDDALTQAIVDDFTRAASLEARRLAMLAYAHKLSVAPGAVVREDVDALRAVGFSDRDVLEIAEVVGYYAYVNRIASGLGVELEEE